jgi:hypothetical protein
MIKKHQAILSNAPEQKNFNTNFGQIKNLRELRKSLYANGKKLFNQHVNEDENHFANWVEHVFKDKELSTSLRNTKSFDKTLKLLDNRIRYAELWLSHNKKDELLYNFAVNLSPVLNEFKPDHHVFETLSNHNLDHVKFVMNRPTSWKQEFQPEKLGLLRLLEYKPKVNALNFFDRFFKKN